MVNKDQKAIEPYGPAHWDAKLDWWRCECGRALTTDVSTSGTKVTCECGRVYTLWMGTKSAAGGHQRRRLAGLVQRRGPKRSCTR